MIRVLTVETCTESKANIEACLANISDIQFTQATDSAMEALSKLKEQKIDVVVIDFGVVDMPVLELVMKIREDYPGIKILIFTDNEAACDIFDVMNAGADGYLLKENLDTALEIAIRTIKLRQVFLDPQIARQVLAVMEEASTLKKGTRVLPTGLLTIPLLPDERSRLNKIAESNCADGVCMVDPEFIKKLRRFSEKE